jgi:hypothetical protein
LVYGKYNTIQRNNRDASDRHNELNTCTRKLET